MPRKKLARRQFLKQNLAATAVVASGLTDFKALSQSSSSLKVQYRGPLGESEVQDRQLDSLQFSLSAYERISPSMSFSETTEASARLWQKRIRRKLTELVGGFPPARCALQARILETKKFNGYTREKIIFQSRENLSVFGYLLLPEKLSSPVPAIVCLPGHGRGSDDIVGIAENGQQRETRSGYAKDFALQVVDRGYAAFAIEQLAFGCRRDESSRKKGAGASSCQPAAGAALLFGQTMIGWRVWDVMRAIDYLRSRSEVAPSRIATMGISGGGTVSLFSAALDERIKVGVVSGYFNTFRDSILSLSHCIDNYVPGILKYIEMYDIFGAPNRIAHEVFDDEHVFYGKGAFEFLKRML